MFRRGDIFLFKALPYDWRAPAQNSKQLNYRIVLSPISTCKISIYHVVKQTFCK
ncbi:hypothetical protein GCHA_3891 [Paraglaciecola chathamensis S18K6]|uniref:Uncharacterized protein n=1 Tax=Paraglaciecola chathamensis S18K6 TaxID=1127672 RepID=A0AAV3V4A2_9ALTE|nr:hypothetical protein GCHA_3891 [Paraglaciecola chathamensis S18K6]